MEENIDRVIMTLRYSRKAFLIEYFCSLFLLSLALIAYLKESQMPQIAFNFVVGLGMLGVASTELRRYYGDRYKIMATKISIIQGFLKIKKKNVYYQPLGFVPDLNIKQTAVQRLLDFGTVFVMVNNHPLELKDIDNPNVVLKMLENLIDETKKNQQNPLQRPMP
ncbi:MAG: PH domain-containing protein [Nanoarchaeota archaeon]